MRETYHIRNLPHLYIKNETYFITFRLANSIPIVKLKQLRAEAKSNNGRIFEKYDELLHTREYGLKYLALPEIADLIAQSMLDLNNKEFILICYTIMPNHVHLVFELLPNSVGISKIMKQIKGSTARKSNLILNRTGEFWQRESFDRVIRNERELNLIIKYVLLNPVKCGLVQQWSDWNYTYYCEKIETL